MEGLKIKKLALAYSGGLDTSIIIPWIKENYGDPDIVAVSVNVGQEEDWEAVRAKALASGAASVHIVDAREEFAREYLCPLIRSGALYENRYLLGTAIARPLQASKQVAIALKENADALAHGCTGKGNDQLRFELTYRALAPNLHIIAPWRLWNIRSREQAIDYAQAKGISIGNISKENIYSRDWNVWHMSHEGGELESLANSPPEEMFQLTCDPRSAPDSECELSIGFECGVPISLGGRAMGALEIIQELNKRGAENGIGRADIVETRIIGIKSRGVYETPAGTILHRALSELEMITLDSATQSAKRQLAEHYAHLVYAGKWFSHYRRSIEAFMAEASRYSTGEIRLALYKGSIRVLARFSPQSLYSEEIASFGESSYDHADASGFIRLYGLSTGVEARVQPDTSSGKALE